MTLDRDRPSRMTLILTTRCNFECSYCYQRGGAPRSMTWEVARAAADLALSARGVGTELTFYGGEPLLEFDLLRRTVDYVESVRPANEQVDYWVVTNGSLIDSEIAGFLEKHGFKVLLSFDGVREAQDLRGYGTFNTLDHVVDSLSTTRPDYFKRFVEVGVTVPPAAVPFLADSVEYLLGKGVREIDLNPVMTPSPGWNDGRLRELETQFARILASSLRHLERTGEIPLKLYSGRGRLTGSPPTGRAMCEIVDSNSWAVDVDGTVSGCVLFAPSIQNYDSGLLHECRPAMVQGNITDPEVGARMSAFPDEVGTLPIVSEKERKHSSARRCADCRFFAACVTCPVSIGLIEGNSDPHRVPDYYCAFNYAALASRDGFPVQPTDLEVIRGDRHRELRLKWKKIGDEARRASGRPTCRAS